MPVPRDVVTQIVADAAFLREATKALKDTKPGETPLDASEVQWYAWLLLCQHKNPTREPWE